MTQLANLEDYDLAGTPAYTQAYEQYLDEILAIPMAELIPITVNIQKVLTATLGAIAKIRALSAELTKLAALEGFDGAALEKLQGHLFALAHAHVLAQVATDHNAVTQHAEMGEQVREVLLADARALANRKLIDGKKLEELKGGRGHRDIAFDLLSIVVTMRADWSNIEGRTALSLEELDRAAALAEQLLTAVGAREGRRVSPQDASVIRQKAFTRFVKTYDEVRRGVHFVRWHEGDADDIAPSVYAGRRRRSRTDGTATSGTDVLDTTGADEVIDLSHLPTEDVPAEPTFPMLEEGS